MITIKEKPKKIVLTQTEREVIKECLEHQDYSLIKFYGVEFIEKLIKKIEK